MRGSGLVISRSMYIWNAYQNARANMLCSVRQFINPNSGCTLAKSQVRESVILRVDSEENCRLR